MSFLKSIRELWDHLRGKGPAAAVALTLDLGEARDNKPIAIEAGGLVVETCSGDLYAKINGPNGDGINLRYVRRISYPFSSLFLTNTAQTGKAARLILLPTGMDADCPHVRRLVAGTNITVDPAEGVGEVTISAAGVGAHDLLSAMHPDTVVGTPISGDLVVANITPKWARFPRGATGQVLRTGIGVLEWVYMVIASALLNIDVSSTLTTYSNVGSGLSFSLDPNTAYWFMFWIVFRTAATTTGINLSINGPASPNFVVFNVQTPTGPTALTFSNRRAYDTGAATTGIDVANADTLAMIFGVIYVGASSGILNVRFASEVAGSQVTVREGSGGILCRYL